MRLDELFPEIVKSNDPYQNFGNAMMPPKKKKRPKKDKMLKSNPPEAIHPPDGETDQSYYPTKNQ